MRMLTVLIAFLMAGAVHAQSDGPQIIVTGEGVVSAAPDMASVNLSVSSAARTAGAALADSSAGMDRVLAALASSGVEPRDVQTTNVGLFPQYEHSNDGRLPRVTGYSATNSLVIRVRDLDGLGELLDRVVGDGANELNGISFQVSDTRDLADAARKLAVEDARRKAEVLAAAAGVGLGPVMMIREGGAGSGPGPMMADTMMEARSAVPIAAGEVDVRASVTLVYGLVGQ